MSGNKILKILLAVAIFATIGATAVSAYATADSFQNPMANYVINNYDNIGGNNRFGKYLWYDKWPVDGKYYNIYHAGEDLKAEPLTPVYAIANGRVVWDTPVSGYGQVLVIEHILPDNVKLASIYGHLSKTVNSQGDFRIKVFKNQDVIKGQLIGYTGYESEIDEGKPHLHFGLMKGADTGKWRYYGRAPLYYLANFYKPSDFLNLIRTVNTNDVYRLSNLGSKAKVPSSTVFNTCQWNWNDIRPVSSTEMNRHSTFTAQSVCFAANTFIKRANNPEISQIKSYADQPKPNRYRQPFGSSAAFIKAGGKSDLSNVKIVSNEEYNLHVQGATLS